MLLSTPYYRTLVQNTGSDRVSQPDFTYGPYDIFCIETRLYPIVYKMLGRNVELLFKTVHEDNRMNLKIQVINIPDVGPEPGKLQPTPLTNDQFDTLQDEVNKILSENMGYALINTRELYIASGKQYPYGWFNTVIGYIDNLYRYNSFVQKEGIYLMFDRNANFKQAYQKISTHLLETIEEYYQDGVVYGAADIAIPWKLERIDVDEPEPLLFRSTWKDNRFAPNLVEFLLQRINGDPYIRFPVSVNMVRRHYIANALSKEQIPMKFEGSYVLVQASNLNDAEYIASLITRAEKMAVGKVLTKQVGGLEKVQEYITITNKILGSRTNCTGYQSLGTKPFVFSCLIPSNVSITALNQEIEDMVSGVSVPIKK